MELRPIRRNTITSLATHGRGAPAPMTMEELKMARKNQENWYRINSDCDAKFVQDGVFRISLSYDVFGPFDKYFGSVAFSLIKDRMDEVVKSFMADHVGGKCAFIFEKRFNDLGALAPADPEVSE